MFSTALACETYSRYMPAALSCTFRVVSSFRTAPMHEVPDESIRALWQEFNLCATGWGVCPKFFEQLCQAMAKSMGAESDENANKHFFAALDTDKARKFRVAYRALT